MSGRGNVGAQYHGGRGGGLFDAHGSQWSGGGRGARSGHDGFAHAGGFGGGGGGGGGRRPWRGGDGPQGHRWEDPQRDGRIQENTGRGQGRGGRGRGGAQGGSRGGDRGGRGAGQGMANKLNTWDSDQHYQNRESGAREQAEGVNFDFNINKVRAEGAPLVDNGLSAVVNHQRERLAQSQALQYEAADVNAGAFLGINLDARNVHSLVDRVQRTQPEGTRYNMLLKAVKPERGLASSEAAKQQFYGAMLSTADPFEFVPDQKDEVPKADEMEADKSRRRRADEQMDRERQKDAAENPNYEETGSRFVRKAEYYEDA